jgi:hypothetical protein
MNTLQRIMVRVAVATSVAISGCSSEPIDDPIAEAAQIEEATQELSINGFIEGPLVLQETPLGVWTYEQLAKRWTQWAMKTPWSTGPITDTTGASCAQNQQGPVWFLAGTDGGHVDRTCTVPAFKPLYFPLVNYFNTPADQYVDTPEEEANYIEFFSGYFEEWRDAVCSLTLRVDGEDVLGSVEELDEALWVNSLEPFPVTLGEDNWGGLPAGVRHKALTAGHYALLLLPPGQHTVELGGTICYDDGDTFDVGVVYDLHVDL